MNSLAGETSPYLLQHKDNPVDWRVWGPAALGEAAAQNKPILLSIGYAACHWCHVMAHESFENETTAALINDLFIPIKLDREERPDLDAIYQHALAMLGQQGGWPLTMFLTAKAEPFWGGTYFPPEPRWGRPGFPQVLQAVAHTYAEEGRVLGNVRALADGLAHLAAPHAGGDIDSDTLDRAAVRLLSEIDQTDGGFGSAPKFPQCSALALLWRGYFRTGDAEMRDAVLLTLDHMAMGGIYDHLGGGFARYATDDAWLVPHFEKMLYDNAQLIELLTAAWVETGRPLYKARVEETIGWMLGEMLQPGGGFAAALDADSEHQEGKFYVWNEPEIDDVLGAETEFFKSHYDVHPDGNWEGKTILNRSHQPIWLDQASEDRLAVDRALLLRRRAGRVRPGLDNKILADWNGLATAALARAARVFARPDWLNSAREAFEFVCIRMQMPRDPPRLFHSWCASRTHPGTLDDHAQLSRAAIVLAQTTGDAGYLDRARDWIAILDRHFRADREHAYNFAADDTDDLIARICHVQDGPVPSGNGTMVEVLASLFHLTGDASWGQAAEKLIRSLSGEISRSIFGLASFLNGIDLLLHAREVVVLPGTGADPHAIWRYLGPNDLVTIVEDASTLPPSHPGHGKTRIGDQTSFYVCDGQTCSLPTSDASAVGVSAKK